MTSQYVDCKEESLEVSRTIKLKSGTWSIPIGHSIIADTFEFSDLNASISITPNNENYVSLYVRLFPLDQIDKKDNRKVTTTIEWGSRSKSYSEIASQYNVVSAQGMGTGYAKLDTINYIKQHPIIRVTLKMNCEDPPRETQSFKERQIQLYELSKVNGDITLIVMNKDVHDEHIEGPPPEKKRKLNNYDNAKNINNSNEGLDPGNNTLKVSGIILQSASPVFKSMLSPLFKQDKKITVYAKDIKCVDDMIYFMCTNELRIDANGMNVFKLANFYQMDVLRNKCINKMAREIGIDNFVEVVNVFDMYGIKDRYDKLIRFGKENVESLKKVDNFDQLSHAFKMILEY